MRKRARRANNMVRQVTETEPTMANINCWSMIDGGKFLLSRVGTWLRAPVGQKLNDWLCGTHPTNSTIKMAFCYLWVLKLFCLQAKFAKIVAIACLENLGQSMLHVCETFFANILPLPIFHCTIQPNKLLAHSPSPRISAFAGWLHSPST